MAATETRTCIIKREAWILHAIDTPERTRLLKEIDYLIARCATYDLVSILPLVSGFADEGVITDPMVQTEVPVGIGRDEFDQLFPGLVYMDEPTTKKRLGTNGQDRPESQGPKPGFCGDEGTDA